MHHGMVHQIDHDFRHDFDIFISVLRGAIFSTACWTENHNWWRSRKDIEVAEWRQIRSALGIQSGRQRDGPRGDAAQQQSMQRSGLQLGRHKRMITPFCVQVQGCSRSSKLDASTLAFKADLNA